MSSCIISTRRGVLLCKILLAPRHTHCGDLSAIVCYQTRSLVHMGGIRITELGGQRGGKAEDMGLKKIVVVGLSTEEN